MSAHGVGEVFPGHFNCTIQELKHNPSGFGAGSGGFQLHHTGIKTGVTGYNVYDYEKFQLHHTGIKTFFSLYFSCSFLKFQLHHTGIKTKGRAFVDNPPTRISIAPYRN